MYQTFLIRPCADRRFFWFLRFHLIIVYAVTDTAADTVPRFSFTTAATA